MPTFAPACTADRRQVVQPYVTVVCRKQAVQGRVALVLSIEREDEDSGMTSFHRDGTLGSARR